MPRAHVIQGQVVDISSATPKFSNTTTNSNNVIRSSSSSRAATAGGAHNYHEMKDDDDIYYELRTLSKQLFPDRVVDVTKKNFPPKASNTSRMETFKSAAQRNLELLEQNGLLEHERVMVERSRVHASRAAVAADAFEADFLEKDITFAEHRRHPRNYYNYSTITTDLNSVVSLYPDPDLLTINDEHTSVTSTSTLLTRNNSQQQQKLITPTPPVVTPELVPIKKDEMGRKSAVSSTEVQPKTTSTNIDYLTKDRRTLRRQILHNSSNLRKSDSVRSPVVKDEEEEEEEGLQQHPTLAETKPASMKPKNADVRNDKQKSSPISNNGRNNSEEKHTHRHPLSHSSKPTIDGKMLPSTASPAHKHRTNSNPTASLAKDKLKGKPEAEKRQLPSRYPVDSTTAVHRTSAPVNASQSTLHKATTNSTMPPSKSTITYGQSCRPVKASQQQIQRQPERTNAIRRRRSNSPTTEATNIARVRSFMNGKNTAANHSSGPQRHNQAKKKLGGQSIDNTGKRRNPSLDAIPSNNMKRKVHTKGTSSSQQIETTSNILKGNNIMSRASKSRSRHQRIKSHSQMYSNQKGMDYFWILTQNGMDTKLFEKLLGRAACWIFNPDGSSGTFSSDGSYMSASLASTVNDLVLDQSVDVSAISNGLMVVAVAAVVIQTQVRRIVARSKVLDRMCAVIVCQAYSRFFLHRSHFIKRRNASVQIQSAFRGFVERFWFRARCYCATKIQSVARKCLAMKETLLPFRSKAREIAVVKIQSFHRGCFIRLCLDVDHFYSTQIQRVFRGYLACNFVRRILSELLMQIIVKRIIVIQSAVRRRAATNFKSFLRFCIIIIQSFFRKCRAKQKLMLQKTRVIQIQTIWRVYFARLCYQFVIYHLITIQSHVREVLGRKKLEQLVIIRTKSTIHIQSSWRGCIARLICRNKIQHIVLHRTNSAVALQKCWRSFIARLCYKYVLYDIITIQSYARQCISKFKWQRLSLNRINVVRIQNVWRSFIARLCYKFVLNDILTIQFYLKRFIVKVEQQRLALFRTNRVICLQNWWRGSIARLCYKFVLEDIIKIQSYARRHNCGMKLTQMILARTSNATMLQACWRGFIGRVVYKFVLCDIIAIQTLARWFLHNLNRKRLISKMSTIIQTCWRGYLSRLCYKFSMFDIITIQTCVRRHLSSMCYKFVLLDIIAIQTCARCFISKLQLARERRKKEKSFSFEILHRAATLVQQSWRMHVCRFDFIYQVASVMLIQSVQRGRIIRKAFYSYTEGYRQFHMTSPFRKRQARTREEEVSLPKSRFLRYLLRRNITLNKEQAVSFLRGVPERFKRDVYIFGNRETS